MLAVERGDVDVEAVVRGEGAGTGEPPDAARWR